MKQNIFRILSLAIIIGGLVLCAYPTSADEPVAPTEIAEMRDEASKTYDNHDGTMGATYFIGAVHYKDDYTDVTEQWKDIDTTIVNGRMDKAPYIFSIDYSSKFVTIKDKKTKSVTTIGLKDIDGELVELGDYVEAGNQICFKDVARDTDVVIEVTSTNVRFKRILKSDDAPLTATFAIYQVGDGITVTPRAKQNNNYAEVKIESEFKDGILTETIAKNSNGQLSYPVEIDPVVDVTVNASTNDTNAYYNGTLWGMRTAFNYTVLGYNSAADYKYGNAFRFLNVAVPQYSTINAAYINITAGTTNVVNNTNSYIIGQLGNSNAFSTLVDFQIRRGTSIGGPDNLLRTVAQVAWDAIAPWTINTTYQSPSIVSVVQEIVGGAWTSGNAMTIFWDDFDGRSTATGGNLRVGWQYDGDAAFAALLHIDYTASTTPQVQTLKCTGFGKDWLLLNGNVTIVSMTQAGFNYGTTTSYGQTAENTYTNYTITSYGYYKYINGLNQATLYHYRANANNSTLGWIYGQDMAFSTGGDSVEWPWEMNITTINTTRQVCGQNWAFQRFTTNVTAHTLTSVDLWLIRAGSPGDVLVTIQSVGSDGLPYGAALCTGTIAAQYTGNINPISSNLTTRYNIKFDKEVSLTPNTRYAIGIKALMGDTSNYIQVANVNTGTYIYGAGYVSSTSGSVWVDTGTSFLFDLWGRSCLQVDNGKVFTGYKATGDWLMVFSYDNVYPPFYPVQDSKQYFAYQLIDYYNVVKAQSPCNSWGLRPGSIYLSAVSVTPLQWGGDYRIRLIDLRDSTVYMEYPLQPTDWLGSDLALLDSWCLSVAQQIGTFYNTPLVTSVVGRGNVLNQNGGTMFATGIPLLDSLRPNLFQVASNTRDTSTASYPQTLRQAYQPATMLGTDAYATMTAIGNLVGVDGKTIGFAGLLFMTVVIAGWGFMPGHTIAATIISAIMFLLAMLTGLLDLLIGALLLAVCFLIFLWKAVFSGG
jgi:hypothetical protein